MERDLRGDMTKMWISKKYLFLYVVVHAEEIWGNVVKVKIMSAAVRI